MEHREVRQQRGRETLEDVDRGAHQHRRGEDDADGLVGVSRSQDDEKRRAVDEHLVGPRHQTGRRCEAQRTHSPKATELRPSARRTASSRRPK